MKEPVNIRALTEEREENLSPYAVKACLSRGRQVAEDPDPDDIRIYEQIFKQYFEKDKYPARMGATTQFIDKECLLMIDGVAYRGK